MSNPPGRIDRSSGDGSIISETPGFFARKPPSRGISQLAAKAGVVVICTGRSASAPVSSETAR